ncbi:hypothetical protein LTR56_009074 [Elasticomyces elasticus]|nr:hypothetical protein LTR56_009074 [Elasticomyces elasticus]KAK3663874.1 hypothetical protein LTR22_005335 [Elasticomyces elasticus]KAK4923915.1 hypothetical protein LTR49_008860 [Elasticomyces elasticus]KAK5762207.1 hypothetical protein LTS12_007728 [Elasticomyces elasticus]
MAAANSHSNAITPEQLQQASDLEVINASGNKHPFKSLYTPADGITKHLIVFIRHFNCGSCQHYVEALTSHKQLTSTPDLKVILIGCGQPSMIEVYKDRTKTPFEIFCDPERKLYKTFGMTVNTESGPKKPEYIKDSMLAVTLRSIPNVLFSGFSPSWGPKGGDFSQNGGELYFVGGEMKWSHVMMHTRDHAEIEELEKVMGL